MNRVVSRESLFHQARARSTDFYLHSRGRANSSHGDGALSQEPPGDEPPDRFDYDPADPVPTVGGPSLLAEYMAGRKLDKEDAGDMKNMPNGCAAHPQVKDMSAPAWNGWGDLFNTRFQPAKASG